MLPQTLGSLCIHCLPYAAYATLSRQRTMRTRVVAALAYTALVQLALWSGADFASSALVPALGLLYFFAATLPVWLAARAFQGDPPSRVVLFLMLVTLFVVVPARLLPWPGALAAVVMGWEVALAAYSYCLEAGRAARATSLRECAFFLLINPALVFTERGRPASPTAHPGRAPLRMALGALGFGLHHALLAASRIPIMSYAPLHALRWSRGYLRFMLHHGLQLLSGYIAHSGRASLDIGCMAALGHELPERYNYPLLATSPLDFWRKWNTYVGGWARRYLFTPCSLWLQRKLSSVPAYAPKAAAVLLTFLAIGAYHDVAVMVRTGGLNVGGTLLFLCHAGFLLGWLGLGLAVSRALGLLRWRVPARMAGMSRWILLAHFLVFTAWLAIPGLSGNGLGPELEQVALMVGSR